MPDSPTNMTVRMTKSGMLSLLSDHTSPCKSGGGGGGGKKRFRVDTNDSAAIDNLLTAQTDALLPTKEPKPAAKPRSFSKIDAYSRFLFPACFIVYNLFYWLYYLVLVKQR
ncbi:unnamed protein product [Dicrocoelium dendriticum]|nr:unnamed protein product [Dicrocoelium dendriticum]